MYGALGAIGTPVVRTDAAAIWATGEFWWQIPRTIQVVLEGQTRAGCDRQRRHHHALRPLQPRRSSERRRRVRRAGRGLAQHGRAPQHRQHDHRMGRAGGLVSRRTPSRWLTLKHAIASCARKALRAFPRATSRQLRDNSADARPRRRLTQVASCSTSARSLRMFPVPTRCRSMQSVAEIEKKRVAIQKAYLVSCVNSRLEDLAAAAHVLDGKKVAPTVKFYLAAASRNVQDEAEKRGIWQTLARRWRAAAASGLRPLHRTRHRTAGTGRSWHLRHQPQLQRPHGIARCPVLSRQSRSGGGIGGRGLHLLARIRRDTARSDKTLRAIRDDAECREGRDSAGLPRAIERTA